MRDFIELLKALSLFISCLVIGYGGLLKKSLRKITLWRYKIIYES